jgi:hypothetical protein
MIEDESLTGFPYFKEKFKVALTSELAHRTSEEEKVVIYEFLLTVAKKYKLHTLFTKIGIQNAVETVFESSIIRDFVLCTSDRFFIETSSSFEEDEGIKSIINHISNGMSFYTIAKPVNKETVTYCYVPDQVMDNVRSPNLKKILENNHWLIVIAMILLTYPSLYEQFYSKLTSN